MRNSKVKAVTPAIGNIRPLSPFFFFDFGDYARGDYDPGDGAPLALADQSRRYFGNGTARGSLDLTGAVGSQWEDEARGFHFDGSVPHYFDEGVDILAGDYADVLSPDQWGTLLLFWRVRYDTLAANQTVFQFGGDNSGIYGLKLQMGQALTPDRHRFQLSNGNGTADYRNEDAGFSYTTGTYYNVALAIDAVNRTFQFWRDAVPGDVTALSANQPTEDNDDDPVAGRRFVIGAELSNDGTASADPFDGRLLALGGINFPAGSVPTDLDRRVKQLHANNCIPGFELHGV